LLEAEPVCAWAALQVAQRRSRGPWYALAGGAAGAAIWMLQTKGAALVVAAGIVTALYYRSHRKHLGWYLLGLAGSMLPLLAWPVSVLWSTLVSFPLQHYLGVAGIGKKFFFVALSAHLLVGLGLWIERAPRDALGLWWLGALLYVSTLSLPDLHHVISNSFATVPLTLWLVGQHRVRGGWAHPSGWMFTALPVAYLLALVVVFFISAPELLPRQQGLTVGQWLRLEQPDIAALVAVVHERVPPGRPIYAGPFLPGLYFEAQRPNATRFSHLLTSLHPPEFFLEARQAISADPPALVILNYRLVEKFSYRQDNPLDEYLRANYRPLEQRGDVLILEPRTGRGYE